MKLELWTVILRIEKDTYNYGKYDREKTYRRE